MWPCQHLLTRARAMATGQSPGNHLPVQAVSKAGCMQTDEGSDNLFPRLDAQEELSPDPKSDNERRQSRFLLNCTWTGSLGKAHRIRTRVWNWGNRVRET